MNQEHYVVLRDKISTLHVFGLISQNSLNNDEVLEMVWSQVFDFCSDQAYDVISLTSVKSILCPLLGVDGVLIY